MLRQCCNDANDDALNENNRVTLKNGCNPNLEHSVVAALTLTLCVNEPLALLLICSLFTKNLSITDNVSAVKNLHL